MSFLQPKIIPRGYIATSGNKTIPRKRLNSVSEISLKPALPNLPRPYVKRATIDPFEQHYVTPFIRMFDEEEAEEAEKNEQNKLITDKQKSILKQIADAATAVAKSRVGQIADAAAAAASSDVGRRIIYGVQRTFTQPLQTIYDFATLPADAVHAIRAAINTGNESASAIKLEAEQNRLEENTTEQNEQGKENGKVLTSQEEEAALRQLKGFITSMYQQKGYLKRMEETKTVQTLLKSQEEEAATIQFLDSLQKAEKKRENERRKLKRPRDDDDDEALILEEPDLKKSHFDASYVFEPNLEKIRGDIGPFLHQKNLPLSGEVKDPEMHLKLLFHIADKFNRDVPTPYFIWQDAENRLGYGVYAYNPIKRRLVVFPGVYSGYDRASKQWSFLPELSENYYFL